jgi:hypothetical protein
MVMSSVMAGTESSGGRLVGRFGGGFPLSDGFFLVIDPK